MNRYTFPATNLVAVTLIFVICCALSAQRPDRLAMPPADIEVGDKLPDDLVIYRPNGEMDMLLDVVKGKYTVLVTGCLTCPIFHRTYPSTEAIYADYKDHENIQFFFIYKSLAHPELNGYVQPVTLDERLLHIKEAKHVLGTTIPWLCDGPDNAVRQAFNLGPNSDMIIDPEGKLIHAVRWTDGDALRKKIVSIVGDSTTHTSPEDLKLVRADPHRRQRSFEANVLPKPKFSSEMIPVVLKPVGSPDNPFYVKPRVEVDQGVLQHGSGEMYLGFFPDPIHAVHWNNLVDPVRYDLKLAEGMKISPSEGIAPKVNQESDGDPREFKLQVISMGRETTAELTFHYYACSSTEGWCKPVTQKYQISFLRDPDGGGTNGRSFRYDGNASRVPGQRPDLRRRPADQTQRPGNRMDPRQIRTRILESDSNGDGKITREELPQQMRQRFDMMDRDGDGLITEMEVNEMLRERFGPQRPQNSSSRT